MVTGWGAPVLEDRGVWQPHSGTGTPHDEPFHRFPAAPAHDRGHDGAWSRAADAARPHPRLQAVCCLPEAIARDGHGRRRAPVPAPPDGERAYHPEPQPHHDRPALSAARDDAAARSGGRDLSREGAGQGPADPERRGGEAAAADGGQAAGAHAVQHRLRHRLARQRGGQAQGQAHRQRARRHSRRASRRARRIAR